MAEIKNSADHNDPNTAQEDEEIRVELANLSACEISDGILALEEPDSDGLKHGGFLEGIEPLFSTNSSSPPPPPLIARAYPVLVGPKTQPSSLAKGAVWSDACPRAHLIVVSQPLSQKCGAIGGIHAARLQANACAGLVVSGRVRDVGEMQALAVSGTRSALPVWCRGRSIVGAGAEGHVVSIGESFRLGGVTVAQGDWIVCDYAEGAVVCVPRQKVREVIEKAKARAEADAKVLEFVQEGESVQEGFAKFR